MRCQVATKHRRQATVKDVRRLCEQHLDDDVVQAWRAGRKTSWEVEESVTNTHTRTHEHRPYPHQRHIRNKRTKHSGFSPYDSDNTYTTVPYATPNKPRAAAQYAQTTRREDGCRMTHARGMRSRWVCVEQASTANTLGSPVKNRPSAMPYAQKIHRWRSGS